MTYTTQQLQAMSDDDLGVAFYDKFCINFDCYNDIMPLAFERKIGIAPLMRTEGKTWLASFSDKLRFEHTNPLRAIACLLLMIED